MDRVRDLAAPVADVHAPEAGEAVEQAAAGLVHHVTAGPRLDHVGSFAVKIVVVGERMKEVRRIGAPELGKTCGIHAPV